MQTFLNFFIFNNIISKNLCLTNNVTRKPQKIHDFGKIVKFIDKKLTEKNLSRIIK